MLKTIRLLDNLTFNRNDVNKSAFNKNDYNKLAFRKNNNSNKIDRFGIRRRIMKYAKKSRKLFKLNKSKNEKTSKF